MARLGEEMSAKTVVQRSWRALRRALLPAGQNDRPGSAINVDRDCREGKITMTSSNLDQSTKHISYIYNLPFRERSEVCKILNQHDKWEELAGKWMELDTLTIENLRRARNPSDDLLTLWGHRNHTVLELFTLLSEMKHYQAMEPLKPFVNQKYDTPMDNEKDIVEPTLRCPQSCRHSRNAKEGVRNSSNCTLGPSLVPESVDAENASNISDGTIDGPVPLIAASPVVLNTGNDLQALPPIAGIHFSPTLERIASTPEFMESLQFLRINTTIPQVSYEELAFATGEWNKSNILGRGGFAVVYKGIWKNIQVAIKRGERPGPKTDKAYSTQLQQSLTEIKMLSCHLHKNILRLYAYSMDGAAPSLVYQFMPNGSLQDRLCLRKGAPPLTWLQRLKIAQGTARGLQFLHTLGHKPLIHGDIKSANILLDEHFEPKIGDFGLARECAEDNFIMVDKCYGTRPYLPEDFIRNKLVTTKLDVYSYGIVLLEIATGQLAYNHLRATNKFLKEYVESHDDQDLYLLIDNKAPAEFQQKSSLGDKSTVGK